MKKLIVVFFFIALSQSISAQDRADIQLRMAINTGSKVEALFEQRTLLLIAGQNTRAVDKQLAELGILFPAKLKMTNMNGKTLVAFPLIEEGDTKQMIAKLAALKSDIQQLEYIGIDNFNQQCYATFEKGSSDKDIEKLVNAFLYDGYYISKTPSLQLGFLGN